MSHAADRSTPPFRPASLGALVAAMGAMLLPAASPAVATAESLPGQDAAAAPQVSPVPAVPLVDAATTAVTEPPAAESAKDEDGDDDDPKTIADRVADLETLDGFVRLHLDHEAGTILLELPAPAADRGDGPALGTGARPLDAGTRLEAIHVSGIRTGLGSNPVGLDRGKLGDTRLIRFREVGGRILLEQQNLDYRATSPDPAERNAVAESFASSVLWAGPIAQRDPDGRCLVDLTSFLRTDVTDIARTLDGAGQGTYSLDGDRSVVDTHATLAFPDNVELESLLTFRGAKPGSEVRATAADASSPSFLVHHSFVRLPDDGYRPRRFDPRMSAFAVTWQDYGAALDEPIRRGRIVRHRLQPAQPNAPRSRAVEPIIYYVDRAAPEPIRTALIEGAGWWAAAFERAGFVDAYRVEVLPEGVHPLDVRYNVIQWVHRATRGWSYGASVVDPRTGEIIKGHVSLGSLRVRQDRRLFEGLAGVAATGTGRADDPIELALARIRQLSAHEVGHTLGFAHNFAGSTQDRASVMDYPAPLIDVRNGRLDFSQAYGRGLGAWDLHAAEWAYRAFPPGADERAELERIVRRGQTAGLRFLSDADARGNGTCHPHANLWDNGAEPLAGLAAAMRVRRHALDRFGIESIATGQPIAHLQEVFVPVYLHHRYQVEAAAKLIGGITYEHAVRGDRRPAAAPVPAAEQRSALGALLGTLDPRELAVPEPVIPLLQPRPFGEGGNRELFPGRTGPVFDPLAAAATAADVTLAALLHPARAARLVAADVGAGAGAGAPGAKVLGLEDVLTALVDRTVPLGADDDPYAELVSRLVVERLIRLAVSDAAAPPVRDQANAALRRIADRSTGGSLARRSLATTIARHFDRPFDTPPAIRATEPIPPGSPIGSGNDDWDRPAGWIAGWTAPEPCGCSRGG